MTAHMTMAQLLGWAFLFPAVGGIAFRLRGDAVVKDTINAILTALQFNPLNSATLVGRLIWAVSLPALAVAMTGDWRLASMAVMFYAGSIPGFPDSIDMGRNEGTFKEDLWGQTLRCAHFTLLPGVTLGCLGYPAWYAAVGYLGGLIYEAAWRTPGNFPVFIKQGPPLAEVYFGATLGITLFAGLLVR